MKNKILLLAAALVLSTTASFASNQTIPSTIGMEVSNTDLKLDMIEQVRLYMESYNIIAVYICEEPGTTNYLVKDTDGIWYIVYVTETTINRWDQVDL